MPPSTPMQQDPLAQLRDIHLPEAISAWPPAPGWWILTAVLLALLATGIYQLIKKLRRNRYRRQALKQLLTLEQYREQPSIYLAQLNQLLKQTALAANTTMNVAGLTGQQWLAFLDSSGKTTHFQLGAGNILLQGPYSADLSSAKLSPDAITELHTIARQWIKHHDAKRGCLTPC